MIFFLFSNPAGSPRCLLLGIYYFDVNPVKGGSGGKGEGMGGEEMCVRAIFNTNYLITLATENSIKQDEKSFLTNSNTVLEQQVSMNRKGSYIRNLAMENIS